MSQNDVTAMPIGAVTRLTGLSSHTLRKWESRYRVVEPLRTDTSRRLYTQVDVQRLSLLKKLVDQGHQISRLAVMADSDLERLLGEAQPAMQQTAQCDRAVVVGEALTEILRDALADRPAVLIPEPAGNWLLNEPARLSEGRTVLVVELPTTPDATATRLIEFRRQYFDRVVAIYGFATQKTVRRLLDGGIVCLKAPVDAEEVIRNLQLPVDQLSAMELLAGRGIPEHRFSASTLGRLSALSPKLQCECPNHIAQLLMDISAFEQYSLECEDTEPAERALHARLRIIAATARSLFEEAMLAVAKNEGISLGE
jgi:MerR family transcriptional regulator, light-induced transcriptional regulator